MMRYGIEEARRTMNLGLGGPFGAVVTDKNGNVISIASNTVLRDNDPTAHAEVNAIRQASKKLNNYDLSGCTLYATGYPCPMCLSAIIWSGIKNVYFGTTLEEAEKLGFRDDFIYNYIKNKNEDTLTLKQLNHDECLKLFEEYEGRTIY